MVRDNTLKATDIQDALGIEVNQITKMANGAPNGVDAYVISSQLQPLSNRLFMLDEAWWNLHLEVSFGVSTTPWMYWLNTVSIIKDDESYIVQFWIYKEN